MRSRIAICTILAAVISGLPGAHFAHAGGSSGSTGMASGDFDGDGHDDLAIAVPNEDVGPEGSEIENAGAVNVIYGTAGGLSSTGNELWHQDRPNVANSAEPADHFGDSIAAGDFDGDGRDDLAVGVPEEETSAEPDADESTGAVHVFYGTANGLSAGRDKLWTQDSPGIKDPAEDGNRFGSTLAAGNLGRSRHDDLAVGATGEDLGNPVLPSAGAANILYGSRKGLRAKYNQFWHQNVQGIEGVSGSNERFGFALAIADFGRSDHEDLAVSVPWDTAGNMNAVDDTGAVNVLYGSRKGLRARNDQRWTQDSEGINDMAQNDDGFGWALAAANLGRSGRADLAVGSPFEDLGPMASPIPNAGAVNVIFGSQDGLRSRHDQFWTEDSEGIGEEAEEYDNFGNSLAAGNAGRGSTADLAVGTPLEDLAGDSQGLVHLIYGGPDGLIPNGSERWQQNRSGVLDDAEDSDLFGTSLELGDFGKTSQRDLAIGVRNENGGAGAINLIYTRDTGLTVAGNQFWSQDSDDIKDVAEPGDVFSAGHID